MTDQLNSLKQLVKHAVKPIKALTDNTVSQDPVGILTEPVNTPVEFICEIPSPYPQPSFIDINTDSPPVEASRQIIKPIPKPRLIPRKTDTPVEMSVDTEIIFAIIIFKTFITSG